MWILIIKRRSGTGSLTEKAAWGWQYIPEKGNKKKGNNNAGPQPALGKVKLISASAGISPRWHIAEHSYPLSWCPDRRY